MENILSVYIVGLVAVFVIPAVIIGIDWLECRIINTKTHMWLARLCILSPIWPITIFVVFLIVFFSGIKFIYKVGWKPTMIERRK